jgi:hypothetical protein
MATATPTLDIHESGADLARKTVFIKLHLGLLGKTWLRRYRHGQHGVNRVLCIGVRQSWVQLVGHT